MADELIILPIDPKVLKSFNIEGSSIAVFEIKQLLNVYLERFQAYYLQLSTEEKAKLTTEQRTLLERTRPQELWFDDVRPTTEISVSDRTKAETYLTFFQDIITRLAGELPTSEQTSEAETDEIKGGGEEQDEEEQPSQLTLEELKAQARTLFIPELEQFVFQTLSLTGQLPDLEEDQINQLLRRLQDLIAQGITNDDLEQELTRLLNPQSQGFPRETFDEETQTYTTLESLIYHVQLGIAVSFTEAYEAEIAAIVAQVAATQPTPQAQQQAPQTQPTTPAGEPQYFTQPGAVVVPPQLAGFDATDIQQLTGVYPSADELPKIIRLRQTVYIQLFGPDLAYNEQFLGTINEYLLSQIITTVRANPDKSPEAILRILLTNQQLMMRVSQFYEQKLQAVVAQGVARKNVDLGIDTLLTITEDPALFLNSLSDEEFERYFGMSARDKGTILQVLQGYFYFRRCVYYSQGLTVRPFHGAGTMGDKEIKRLASDVRVFALTLDKEDISVVEAFNSDDEYAARLDQRKREFIEQFQRDFILQFFADQEAQENLRAILTEEYGVVIPDEDPNVLGYVPDGVSASSLIAESARRDFQNKGTASKVNDKIAKLIGKATIAGAKVVLAGTPAAPVVLALDKFNGLIKQFTGVDVEELIGKIVATIAIAVAAIGAILAAVTYYLITHAPQILLGAAGAGTSAAGAVSSTVSTVGFGRGEKEVFGKTVAKGLGGQGGIGGSLSKAAAKLGVGAGGTGFVASTSVLGMIGATTIGAAVVQNAQRTPLARPVAYKGAGTTAGQRLSDKICWPVDAAITTNATGFYSLAIGGSNVHLNFSGKQGRDISVDLGAAENTPIYAPFDGTIEFYSRLKGQGNAGGANYAILSGKAGEVALLHIPDNMAATGVASGDEVYAQEHISYVGQTGRVTGPHLHYESIATPLSTIIPESVVGAENSFGPTPPKNIGSTVSHLTCQEGEGSEVPVNDDFASWCEDAGEPLVYPGVTTRYLPETNDARAEAKANGLCHRPTQLVIHWAGPFSTSGVWDSLAKRGSACAYTVDANSTWQMQPVYSNKIETGICSHQNSISIDIEIAGKCFSTPDAQLANKIGGETGFLECMNGNSLAVFPPSQGTVSNATNLAKWIMEKYSISCANVKGHYQTAPGVRADAGPNWMNNVFRPAIGCPAQ